MCISPETILEHKEKEGKGCLSLLWNNTSLSKNLWDLYHLREKILNKLISVFCYIRHLNVSHILKQYPEAISWSSIQHMKLLSIWIHLGTGQEVGKCFLLDPNNIRHKTACLGLQVWVADAKGQKLLYVLW